VPYLVGGTFAFAAYTGISRPTKDLDLFVTRDGRDRALEALRELGWQTHIAFAHWLAKAQKGAHSLDVIHGAGNGVAMVDDEWFAHARPARVFGVETRLVPAEEMVWSKAFVMEKYRYDGADVAHLLLRQGASLDWKRMLRRFGRHWRVLLSHLVLFEFIYPGQRVVPPALVSALVARVTRENGELPPSVVCRGVLLSRKQYRIDTESLGAARRAARLGRRDEPRGHRRVDAGRPRAAGSGRLTMRIAAVGDVHCSKKSEGQLQAVFAEAAQHADVLLLCGDLTHRGLPDEARLLVRELKTASVPVLAVLGNHDFESNEVEALVRVLEDGRRQRARRRDLGEGRRRLRRRQGLRRRLRRVEPRPWGEPVLKQFVQEATAGEPQARARAGVAAHAAAVALMHYAPIAATVAGEPLEIQPFLGSGRLEEPLDRYHVDVTFHGHAHRGSLEGRTRGGTPVYNVALPLLQSRGASPSVFVLDLEALAPARDSPAAATGAGSQGGSHAV
jgi:Icc-related predicted phosphoesterase